MRECIICGDAKINHNNHMINECADKLDISHDIIYTLKRHLDLVNFKDIKAISKILTKAKKKGLK
tara:strand:+ start:342 stop:536 length:195 start_codon:yes stop_codon:yes gene_type:complete